MKTSYKNIEDLLSSENPQQPVYCIYPAAYQHSTKQFVDGFPGRVLYAVKANDHPDIIKILYTHGVRHFDCASLAEIELVNRHCPGAECYFMNPVRYEGDARIAQQQFGVRHFVIDHHSGVEPLINEIDPTKSVVFARLAVSHHAATQDLSSKFGAPEEDIPSLLVAIKETGAEPALAFNVGTSVKSPEAYAFAMTIAGKVLEKIAFKVRLLDIGGGFPFPYPEFDVARIDEFLQCVKEFKTGILLTGNGELLAEPGRALSAPGLSAVTRVLLRKPGKVYLNDGMYGAFWELRCKGHVHYPCRVFRDGKPLVENTQALRIFGPTCDSSDEFPAPINLPENIEVGDHIEFGTIGAYSLSGRTSFNGFYSDRVITFTGEDAQPPSMN